jgi:hypothetical protein
MSKEDAHIPDIKGLGAALDSGAIERASRAINSPFSDAVQKAIGNSQLSDIGARMSSVLESSGAMKSLSDLATQGFKLDVPDSPRLTAFDYATPNYTIPDLSSSIVDRYRMDWQQLIIIGNGFDLQCGLRSKFGDFFQPRFDIIAAIPDCKRETWRTLVENSRLTLWDFILEANVDSLWCDIEGAIERWVLSAGASDPDKNSPFDRAVELLKVYPFTDGAFVLVNGRRENEQDDESHMYGNMARYAWTLHPEIASEGYNRELFMAFLRQELLKLEHAFGEYLAHELETNEGYAEKCKMLYQAIERDGKKSSDDYYSSTSVLSFNYTDLIERFFDGGEDGAFVNIHGKLGGEIIFGIDGKDCMDNPSAVAFTKTFRLMQRGGSRTDKLISTANSANLQDATDVIKFYGHSLGRADYSYFQSIFDGVDLYESKTVLVFYYPYDSSADGKDRNEEWRNGLANSINDLLVAYGATMDNKDHGKNLMHKLLLEGRLIIRGIQFD